MNTIDDETLGAYLDGELDAAARATVERAIAANPDLARRVSAQRGLRERLQRAYDGTLAEPVPSRLIAVARGESATSNVETKAAPGRSRRWQPAGWIALAASFVLAVVLVPRLANGPGSSSLFASSDGKRIARGELAAQLSSALASTPTNADEVVRVGLSYRAQSGEYCRTFEVGSPASARAGIACHETSGAWRVDALERVDAERTGSGPMRQASGADLPEPVRRAIEATIDGDPLDAAAEAAAAQADWPPAAPPGHTEAN
jgi:negative regulator of sigma E activity